MLFLDGIRQLLPTPREVALEKTEFYLERVGKINNGGALPQWFRNLALISPADQGEREGSLRGLTQWWAEACRSQVDILDQAAAVVIDGYTVPLPNNQGGRTISLEDIDDWAEQQRINDIQAWV